MDSGKHLTEALVAGVDGCRAGWIFVLAGTRARELRCIDIQVVPTVIDLIEATRKSAMVCIDMPIGFPDAGSRAADIEARRFIGPRRSSVFPPPVRSVLEADGDYARLNALSKQTGGGLSQQTYNLMPKMREIDRLITPTLQSRMREAHPEVSFCALNGDCLHHPKRRPEGKLERQALLSNVFGECVSEWRPPPGAAIDDLYDAAVLAWTAARVVNGASITMPSTPSFDNRGLRMEIVY